ncbi:TylF/MycF/NovP-related O-methyltransferase [Mycobacterium avium]|uniref:TylF/MycF/NovP-related O-methyltransferase n=1 Tax=Mycobacterium avium TaxID=1764 RepID=UPI0007A055DA|nr:TylF/MycF/NovP-related O-methyltransferase [Mycobacterium avium]MBZ4581511.1 asparagine synthase [Mycobacterium avium subsp. hominissuis]PBJ59371.1 asparagine synthase [Mycobacterium avium subsp. hominissuis]
MLADLRDALAAHRLARQIRRDRLTYLTHERLASLRRAAHDVGTVPGAVVECGVALGGSGIWLASLLKDREYHGYDVFDQIPPPGPQDPAKAHERYAVIASGKSKGLGEDTYYGYLGDLLDRVSASFASYNLTPHLHKGLFEDSLHPEWPIALAHIDCDWYEPVSVCLQRITPWLACGARVIIDDYFDYGGSQKAVDEHLAGNPGFSRLRNAGHLVLGYTTR